jgi:hypothetical protein
MNIPEACHKLSTLTPLIVTVIPERMDSPAKYRFMAALLK